MCPAFSLFPSLQAQELLSSLAHLPHPQDRGKVSQAFGLPSYIKPICLLPVGYASADSVPYAPWHDVYRDIGNFTEVL